MTAWIIGVGPGGAELGRARADQDGRSFLAVDDLDDPRLLELADSADSLFVVAERLRQRDVLDLSTRMSQATAHRSGDEPAVGCPIGFLHARDLDTMRALDDRQRSARPDVGDSLPDVLLDCTLTTELEHPVAGMSVVPYRGVSRDAVLAEGPMRLLALTAHGMSDLLHLDGDYLCGRARTVSGHAGREVVPSCLAPDKPVCVFKPTGMALPAYELPAEHVFVNSCGSARYEASEFGDEFSIWYSVLEGTARSFVGTIRWKEGHGLEGLFYRHLLNAGYPLGQAVALLNAILPAHQIEDGPVYTLIGDPEDRVSTARPEPAGTLAEGRNTVMLDGGFGYFRVTDPALVHAFADGGLLTYAVGHRTVWVSQAPARDGRTLHVFVYAYDEPPAAITLRCLDFRAQWERVRLIRKALSESLDPGLGIQGIHPDRVRQGVRLNVENRLLNTARLVKRSHTEPHVISKLLRNCEVLEKDVGQLDEDTATWLRERIRSTSYRFSEQYQESFALAGTSEDGTCHLCGDTVIARRQTNLLNPVVHRVERICPRCGGIEDSPDSAVSLQIGGDRIARRGGDTVVPLLIANHTDRVLAGHCFVAVRRAAELDVTEHTEPARITIRANGKEEVLFVIRFAESMPAHQYDLQAAFVSTAKVYTGRRPVWLC